MLDNRFEGGNVAIEFERGAEGRIAGNTITGAGTGAVVRDSSPTIEDNNISGASLRGLSIEGLSEPTLTGNTICDNAENLAVPVDIDLEIDDSNEICS